MAYANEKLKTKVMYLKKELYELIKTDESIFDFIQNSSLDGLWYWDLENPENEWMNAKFWTVLGYNPDDMPHLSAAWQGIIHQDDLKVAKENFTKHCKDPNHPYDQIVRYTHKNGSTVWIRCRGLAIRDEDGKPIRMLGAHQDVTELKKSEHALLKANEKVHESEEKYRAFYDNAPLSYQSLDENGCFIDINPMWLKTLGYQRSEVIGKWFGDFLHPDYVGHFRKNFPDFKIRGYVSHVQFKLRRKDDSFIHVAYEGCIGYTPDGKFKQTYCVFKEITELKQAEEVLKSRENLLNKIFDILPIGLWFADANGRLIRGNPAGVKIWGAEPTVSIEDYGVFKARHHPSGKEIEPDNWALAHTIRKGVTIGDEQLEIDAFDGQKKIILNYTAPVLDEQGNIQGAIVVNQDITARKKAEDALKAKMDELERFHKLMVGREITMVELKKEVNDLLNQLGKHRKYKIVE